MPCLEHRVSVGCRVHGRSEDRVSQQRFQRFVTGRLAGPRGDRVSPEGRHCRGLCEPGWKLTAVRTVSARRSGHMSRSWATAKRLSPGREVSYDPEVSLVRCDRSRPRTVAWKLRQRPQIRWRWRREACFSEWGHPEMVPAETAPGWTTWKHCLSKSAGPEAGRFYSRGSHEGTEITVRFRRSRRSTPSDSSDGLRAHHATLVRAEAR